MASIISIIWLIVKGKCLSIIKNLPAEYLGFIGFNELKALILGLI